MIILTVAKIHKDTKGVSRSFLKGEGDNLLSKTQF